MGIGEDSGKKHQIRDFLKRVNEGIGFIEDIWVEREVKKPGSEGKFNQARSLSGRPIFNITDLLKDDISHTFDDSLFTFRMIAASPGSGKTTLLEYLCELIESEPRYRNHSIIVKFPFNELLSNAGGESFGVNFYSYILTQTFWVLMRDNTNLSRKIQESAENFLTRLIGKEKVAHIKLNTDDEMLFTNQFNIFISEVKVNFKKLFFSVIQHILKYESQVSFVYLIDELDSLQSREDYLYDAITIIRDLINETTHIQKLRLIIYIVGVEDDVDSFIKKDDGLYSRVFDHVINLVAYHKDECEKIKLRIEDRIEGAYFHCKDFNQAWDELKNINLEPNVHYTTLREFCKIYSQIVITIHETYFRFFDEPFNRFESKARELVETEARKKWLQFLGDSLIEEKNFSEKTVNYLGHNSWRKYKGKGGYSLLISDSTTRIKNHNVDCYVELRHNNDIVAKAYGEAKNYSLIKEHLNTFQEWLNDFGFYGDNLYPDLAFLIAPGCTELQRRKLKNKNIEFLETEKIIDQLPVIVEPQIVNINTADKELLIKVLRGTRIQQTTIDKIINNRTYSDLDDLESKIKNINKSMKAKFQAKIDNNEIGFF
ncbi:hypothetical protein IQ226_15890 [Dolichospermum sp. LEGE 00240]|uniref:hypothetical protein n=1 Tax=Dolichospermum sp. LEGE 00240 TaxID=1828603 RepID=UPI001881EBD3|nr:hypothetical protein [Dolichospermum sp. LEGE 00240]MBE9250596.1 hypothetical protein [Dolichospermum sp. LEGE 00240]MDM3851790.1 hypothetical protein [Aphanizomenon gracile PMC627.10]MDM3860351.1 hypothetical protein [Aphanizomenon gracile PMC644.10]